MPSALAILRPGSKLVPMARLVHPLRRAFFATVTLLLVTLPLFAWIRFATPYCGRVHPAGLRCDDYPAKGPLLQDGSWHYAFWQTGLPTHDYWPLGLALLAAAAVIEGTIVLRSRRSH